MVDVERDKFEHTHLVSSPTLCRFELESEKVEDDYLYSSLKVQGMGHIVNCDKGIL